MDEDATKPITRLAADQALSECKELYASGVSLESMLPLKHTTTGFVWEGVSGACGRGKARIPGSQMRGRLTAPAPQVFDFTGVGACHQCRVYTRFRMRLNDTGEFSMPTNAYGGTAAWNHWTMKPQASDVAARLAKRLAAKVLHLGIAGIELISAKLS